MMNTKKSAYERLTRRPLAVGLAAVALVAAFGLVARGARSAKITGYHWRTDGCTVCHEMKGDKIERVPLEKVDAMCLRCHDGKKASYELHPVGVTFKGDQLVKPAGWPLSGDKIGCLTCHDIMLLCRRDPVLPLVNPAFLRGRQGGDIQAFCAHCHKSMPYKNAHPHIMLRADNTIHENICLLCHTQVPDRKACRRTGKPQLRSSEMTLCKSCHPNHVDYFEPGHIGRKVPPDILAYMAARESCGPAVRPSADLIAQKKASHAQPVRMVLDAEGKLTCTTCHNPHQEGLFPDNCTLADNAMHILGSDKVLSPVRSREFCLRCHNK